MDDRFPHTVKNAVEAPYHGISLLNHELVFMHVLCEFYAHFMHVLHGSFRFCFQDVQLRFRLLFASFPADLGVPHVITEGLAE